LFALQALTFLGDAMQALLQRVVGWIVHGGLAPSNLTITRTATVEEPSGI
jgi:hypothetical protein